MKVGLLVTCLVDLHRPNVGFAAIRLLEQAGFEVVVPPQQTCCGQPAYNSGDQHSSRTIARQIIEAFDELPYVVVPSGSCAAMLIEHYPSLFDDDPAWRSRACSLAERCHELTVFLADPPLIPSQGEEIAVSYPHRVTYHDSCSGLRELGIRSQPRALLGAVQGMELSEMADTEVCCGFGGTFCVKYPEISERMVSDKIALAIDTGADTLLGGDLGCLLNISGRLTRLGLSLQVYHVAEVLADMTAVPPVGHSCNNRRG